MSVNHNSNYNMDIITQSCISHLKSQNSHTNIKWFYYLVFIVCVIESLIMNLAAFFIHQNLLFFSGQIKNKRIVFLSCTLGLRYDKLLGEYVTSKSSDSPSLPQKNVKQLLAICDYTKVGRFFFKLCKNIVHNIDMLIAHAFCLHCQEKLFLHSR